MIKQFPFLNKNKFVEQLGRDSDQNPAIQLFGRRLTTQQTLEVLIEFLLVVNSHKILDSGDYQEEIEGALPTINQLLPWETQALKYSSKARLNLKLFSFLPSSKLESRHKTHEEHFKELEDALLEEKISTSFNNDKTNTIKTLESFFSGLFGAGKDRTWPAKSFFPLSPALLSKESIWKEKEANKNPPDSWDDIRYSINKYFSFDSHNLLMRGGEVLYLQICNALKQDPLQIKKWMKDNDLPFEKNEIDPSSLREELDYQLRQFFKDSPIGLNELAESIDTQIEELTSLATDEKHNGAHRYTTAGWCPEETWEEGYIFAIELLRILKTDIDIADKIYLLETLFAIQIIRTLIMQSSRYVKDENPISYPRYRIAISSIDDKKSVVKNISQENVEKVERQIHKAIRSDQIPLPSDEKEKLERLLKEADSKYGGKLFLSLSKKIGLIIPKQGNGARFVLNEELLKLFIITTIAPTKKLTFETFKKNIERHYGFVFDNDGISIAHKWINGRTVSISRDCDNWLQEMLDKAGFLIHLSDSSALVKNPWSIK